MNPMFDMGEEIWDFSDYAYCPKHPTEIVSNGQFDAPCGHCEGESEEAAIMWDQDPTNPRRRYCGPYTSVMGTPRWNSATCQDVASDEIPF